MNKETSESRDGGRGKERREKQSKRIEISQVRVQLPTRSIKHYTLQNSINNFLKKLK